MPKYFYATVIDALQKLKEAGYTEDFNLIEEEIAANTDNYSIEVIYRYEGVTDPDDEAFVFGIKTASGQKGVFVMGAAAASEGSAANFLYEIAVKGKP